MLNERQLAVLEHLENQPLTLAELARRAGVSTRTLLRDVDYLNLTLSGKARITTGGNATWQLEIFDRASYFRLLQRHDNDDRLLAILLLNAFTTRRRLAEALNLPETWIGDKLARLKAVALAGYPDIPRDYLHGVILAVYALRHRLDAPPSVSVSDALAACVAGMGLSLRPPALQTLTAILDTLQSRARKITPQRIAALLEQVRDNYPPAIIDATLIDNLTGHVRQRSHRPLFCL
ncbi:MAG: transcriptional regulator [Enterobacter kobei]|nr:transcriptional regulator [Enterobacter kobei]